MSVELSETATRPGGRGHPPQAPSVRRRRPSRREGTGRLAAILVSPTLIVLGLVVAYPLLSALRESLFRARDDLDAQGYVIEGDVFVGMLNFTDILFGSASERFWNALWNTTFFTVTTVALETVLGVSMALVMHRALRGRAFVRASILVPWAVPTAVSALMWRWIFAPDGIANVALGQQILWSANATAAKIAVITAEVWKTAPFVGLLVLAGLQLVPQEVNEAAKVDGCSAWTRFWRVTLPLVKPALLVAVLFRMLDALRMFDLPFVLIGQQKDSVETLSMLAWEEAANIQFGPAAAYATIMFAYVAMVAFAFVRLLGADVMGEARTSVRRKQSASVGKGVA